MEAAVTFTCAAESLVGVLSIPDQPTDTAVVIVVGGPQYRAGSHRQFVSLARALAKAGFVAMRFDVRGMGDSSGEPVDFERSADDIEAAMDATQSRCPSVRRIVLCGLCDGASAALLYVGATQDRRVAGVVLLNPWVRSETSLARTHVRHYYLRRLAQREFWTKLFSGRVAGGALSDLLRNLMTSWLPPTRADTEPLSQARPHLPYQQRMAKALAGLPAPAALILSGNDFTAREFSDHAAADPLWRSALNRPDVRRIDISAADHTFSTAAAMENVHAAILQWLGTAVSPVAETPLVAEES